GLKTPLTAGVQSAEALALLLLSNSNGRQRGALLALVPLGVGTLVLLSFGAGAPLLDRDSALAMSLPSAFSVFLLGLALLCGIGTRVWPLSLFRMHHGTSGEPVHPRAPMILFGLVVGLLGLGGAFYLRGQLAQARRTAEGELRAIAELKATEISEWYRIRVSVADQALHSSLVYPMLQRALAEPSEPQTRELLSHWMASQRTIHGFQGIVLLDAQEHPRLTVPEGGTFGIPPRMRFEAALARPDVTVVDLHRDPGGEDVHLGLTVPVTTKMPPFQGRPLGALYFHLSGSRYLFPLIQAWPVPSATAETELIRPEDGEAVFLNDLRHRPGSSLNLRVPLVGRSGQVEAKAIGGRGGLLEGRDYRGAVVLAAARRVEGTPWFTVAKIDESEVYGPVRRQVWITGTLLLGLILAAGFGLGMLLRERDAEALRARLALERDQARLSVRYELLMRQANDAILLLDAKGRICEANAQAEAQYGFDQAALRERSIWDLCGPGALEDLKAHWASTHQAGLGRFESLHRHRDGNLFPVEVSGSRVDLDGAPFVLIVVRDITERQAKDAQLARMNRLYASLSQINQGIVWSRTEAELLDRIPKVLTEHGGFSLVWIGVPDPETHRVQAVSRAGDRTGLLDRIEVREDGTPEGRGAVGQVLRSGEACLFEDFLAMGVSDPWREELGRAGLTSLAAFPLRRGERVWGVLAVYASEPGAFGPPEMELLSEAAMDVSFALDHLDAESEHRRITERLNEVEKLDSLGSLAAGVAHDMNNVLTAILTLATLHGESQAKDSGLARALDTMARACLRGRDLVMGLLSFARRELEQEGPLELNALAEEAVQLLARTTLQRVAFHLDLEPSLPPLRGDAGALHRTLMNLCVNAVDAMPHGGTVTLSTRAAAGGGLELRVRDTGEGMSDEVARRALEPFFTTKPRGKGTGLGLAMAYGTLKAHGGDLEIHSRPGAGTEIVLKFPASRVQRHDPAGEAPEAEREPIRRRLRILLVDDDDLVRESVVSMLQAMGHHVETSSGGLEALRRFESGLSVDLVILDMNMPGMTGAEVLPRLLALRPGLPVLMASGYRDEHLAALIAPHPQVLSLAKPFTFEEIREKLGRMVPA
ncbi:MAG TPA: ATP-binding protein, partial [Holophagaceae bacterium]